MVGTLRQCGAVSATKPPQHQDDTMPHQFSRAQTIRKPAIKARGGIVAAQSRRAAAIGAQVLAAGGDCVDAIVATTFALNVLEPWNSGIGGGGAMVLYRAGSLARWRRPAGRLVDHTDDRELGGRSSALPRQRSSVPERRPAAERAMGHQVRDAAAAGHIEGNAVAPRRSRTARLLPGRS